MKKSSILALVAAAVLAAVPLSQAQAKTYRVIFAGYFGPDHPNTAMMEHFKNELESVSDGQFKVTLKPNNEAGGEEKIMELCKRGTIQIAQVGGLLKYDEPMIAAWEQPFVINSWDHARKVFLSGGMKPFEGQYTEKSGARIAGVIVNGFRQISCNYPINNMEDLGRMKIRTPLNDVFVELFKALGTNPTPMPATEQYTALQQGTIDAQENPLSIIDSNKLYEVQHYISLTGHQYSPQILLMNKARWESLSDAQKKAMNDGVETFIKVQRERSIELDALSEKKFKDAGCEIITLTDEERQQWIDKAKEGGVYDLVKSMMDTPEYVDRVLNKDY